MTTDPRCCGSGTCIIDTEGRCWCGQQWDGMKMAAPLPPDGRSSTRQVAEGAKSCASIYDLAAKHGVDAPVAEHVDQVVRGEISARDMMYAFIARDTKHEKD